MIVDDFQKELDTYYCYPADHFVRYTHRLRIERFRQLINASARGSGGPSRPRALDAGTGFGVYALLMAEAGYEVRAFDINPEEIDRAAQWARERGLLDRIDFRVGDLLRYDDGTRYEFLVCSEVLEHLEDPRAGAANLFRLLEPGGRALISMPNMACLHGLLQALYRKSGLRALLGRPPLDLHQIQHSRYWFGNIADILTGAGFQIETSCSTSHIPFAWTLDRRLSAWLGARRLTSWVDARLGALPIVDHFGFNFIVMARKPPHGG